MGGALRRPTKFDCGATLQQSSNIFYQKFLKIVSVGGCGEEKAPQNCFAISGVKV
jgi:hypothetical protein